MDGMKMVGDRETICTQSLENKSLDLVFAALHHLLMSVCFLFAFSCNKGDLQNSSWKRDGILSIPSVSWLCLLKQDQ